ncbi:MAG: hypothetical protein KDB68_08125 [Planctomycetes bacterium]|nr:hypothetical protein [Planctomycetota bacterium]
MASEPKRGHVPFNIDCPYTLVLPKGYDAGRAWPMVMALHGMGHTHDIMRRYMTALLDRPWMWVFPRGVYPFEMRQPEKIRIGYAWYLYTGDQPDLRASMALSAQHLLNVQDLVRKDYPISHSAVVGFSQGGYLSGYVAPHHPERFKAAASLGGRLKHEFLDDVPTTARETVALAQFHGGRDANVSENLAREGLDKCAEAGFKDTHFFSDPDAAHEVSEKMVEDLGKWLERVLQ